MSKKLPKPRGAMPEPTEEERKPAPARSRRRPNVIAERREDLRDREAARAQASTDGKAHERFKDTEYAEGEYDDGGTGEPWVHVENPAMWSGSICDD